MFLCIGCGAVYDLPRCACGRSAVQQCGIWQFCGDPPVRLDGDDQYIGYDGIGDDFEPSVTYWDANNRERYGVYEACGDLIAQKFGCGIRVLDLGAGLGTASLPLAKHGMTTVAADISNVMLSTAVKRAAGKYPNFIPVRMNASRLMLADHSMDMVVENALLHLVDNPEKVLREIVRVLKPDGSLVRYVSPGQATNEEEREINARCNDILSDITGFYDTALKENGYEELWFDNRFQELFSVYFREPQRETAVFTEVFTEKMRFRLHRLKTMAHSGFQSIPREILREVWRLTDEYARKKYGEGYTDIPGFSRYGAAIDRYRVKN